jgi:membrane-bound metal-dependent hydrolase YbcI (DUF457 family)
MLNVSGVATRVKKAGNASVKSFQQTRATAPQHREITPLIWILSALFLLLRISGRRIAAQLGSTQAVILTRAP